MIDLTIDSAAAPVTPLQCEFPNDEETPHRVVKCHSTEVESAHPHC